MGLIDFIRLLKGWQVALIQGFCTLLAMCLLVFYGFAWGVTSAETQADLKAVTAQLATEREHASRLAALSRALAEVEQRASDAAERTEQAERTLQQEISLYAKRAAVAGDSRPCLDADGLRLWRAANASAHPDTAAASGLATGLPATASAARRHSGEPAAKPRRGGDALPALPGSPRRAGGLHQGDAQ